MAEGAEVGVKLKLDKSSEKLAKEMANAMKNAYAAVPNGAMAHEKAEYALHNTRVSLHSKYLELSHSARGAMSSLSPVISGVAGVGTFAMSALAVGATAAIAAVTAGAYAADARMRSLKETAQMLIAVAPDKNVSMAAAKAGADAYDMMFRRIAISSGTTRAEVQEAWKAVAHGLGPYQGGTAPGMPGGPGGVVPKRKTAAEVDEVTNAMAQASRIVPGGIGALTAEYQDLKTGKFASSGAIATMVTTTGVLKGNAFEVANQMARMTDAKRMETAEQAMRKMAQQAKDMPMSFGEVANMMSEIYDLGAASFGEPFVAQLMPLLTDVKTWFVNNATTIEITARQVGGYVAGFVQGVGHIVQSFYSVFSSDSGKLGKYVQEAFDYAKGAFQWIVDNATPLAKTFRELFDTIIGALEGVIGVAKSVVSTAIGARGVASENKPKGSSFEERSDAAKAYLERTIKDLQTGQVGYEKHTATIEGQKGSYSEAEIAIKRARSQTSEMTSADAEAYKQQLDEIEKSVRKFSSSMEGIDAGNVGEAKIKEVVAAYNSAGDAHNDAQQRYVQNMLKGNEKLQESFIKFGGDVHGGLVKLATDMGDSKFLDMIRDSQRAGITGTKPLAPVVNFNGNTFNIKQDFRDQDPDRVMLVFKRDILDSARNQTQSRLARGFGL